MYENRWGVIVFLSLLLFFAGLIFLRSGERVAVECIIFDKGVSFSETGNIPNVRCKLENGRPLIVTKTIKNYNVGDVITVYVRKSNIN